MSIFFKLLYMYISFLHYKYIQGFGQGQKYSSDTGVLTLVFWPCA